MAAPDLSTASAVPVLPTAPPEPDWHAQRRLGIGGSDVHNLFPCLNLADKDDPGSRCGCPRCLAYEKLGAEPDFSFTPEQERIFERGHILEDAAAQKYMEKTGVRVFRANKPFVSTTHPFMRVNIDRRIKQAADVSRKVLECKSANPHVFLKMQQEGLPTAYGLQLQHAIHVCEYDAGDFAVIECPEFVDGVIERIADGPTRTRTLNAVWPSFDFLYFEQKRDQALIDVIIQKEETFWNLIEQGKLADPLPEMNDERCKSCRFRRTCRGQQFAEMNAKIPTRDKKNGVVYTPIEEPAFIETAGARLLAMKQLDELEEAMAALDNELKQNFPMDADAVCIPGTQIKARWRWQKGQTRWDADALKADSKTISRKLAFADWANQVHPELLAAFQNEVKQFPSFEEQYKRAGSPTRPFVFTCKEEE